MQAPRLYIILLFACASLFAHAQDGKTAGDAVYDFATIGFQPEFQGGHAAMYAWMKKNTVYPDSAFLKGIQERVYVQFVVEKDGHIDHVILLRGTNPWLNEEAVRVVGKMPDWNPGRLENGAAVRVRFTIPIDFKL